MACFRRCLAYNAASNANAYRWACTHNTLSVALEMRMHHMHGEYNVMPAWKNGGIVPKLPYTRLRRRIYSVVAVGSHGREELFEIGNACQGTLVTIIDTVNRPILGRVEPQGLNGELRHVRPCNTPRLPFEQPIVHIKHNALLTASTIIQACMPSQTVSLQEPPLVHNHTLHKQGGRL
jgi:hypothetical protein